MVELALEVASAPIVKVASSTKAASTPEVVTATERAAAAEVSSSKGTSTATTRIATAAKVTTTAEGTAASSTEIAAAEVITPSFGIAFTLPFAQFIAGQTTGCRSQATGCPGIHAPLRWRTVPLVRRTIGTIALIGFLVKRWSASERRRTHAE